MNFLRPIKHHLRGTGLYLSIHAETISWLSPDNLTPSSFLAHVNTIIFTTVIHHFLIILIIWKTCHYKENFNFFQQTFSFRWNTCFISTYYLFPIVQSNKMKFYLFVSLSVSESVEWVCTKFDYPNGTVVRSCEQTYTGTVLLSCPVSRRTQVLYFLRSCKQTYTGTALFSCPVSRRTQHSCQACERTCIAQILYLWQALCADVRRYCTFVSFCEQVLNSCQVLCADVPRHCALVRFCKQMYAGTVLGRSCE